MITSYTQVTTLNQVQKNNNKKKIAMLYCFQLYNSAKMRTFGNGRNLHPTQTQAKMNKWRTTQIIMQMGERANEEEKET